MAATWALEKVPTSAWDFLLWSNSWEVGTAMACQVDGTVTRMRWYRRTTNVGDAPVAMHLWDAETEAILHTVDPIPDDGAVGWQIHTIDDPVAVGAGQIIIPAYEVAYGKTLAYTTIGYGLPHHFQQGWQHQSTQARPHRLPASQTDRVTTTSPG
jgi:hypothetical protein